MWEGGRKPKPSQCSKVILVKSHRLTDGTLSHIGDLCDNFSRHCYFPLTMATKTVAAWSSVSLGGGGEYKRNEDVTVVVVWQFKQL